MPAYKSRYCFACKNGICARRSCHGKKFELKEDYASKGGFNPAPNCYIPKGSEYAFALLLSSTNHLKPVTPDLNYKLRQMAVIITYKGKGERKTFKGWGIYLVDFGNVGFTYADLSIVKCLQYLAPTGGKAEKLQGPLRLSRHSHTIYLATTGTRPVKA